MKYYQDKKLTIQEIKHIAHLARIELAPAEKEKFSRELSAILNYVAQLNEVNTDKIEPTSQVTGLENIIRPDKSKIQDKNERQDLLKSVPQTQGDYLKVKSVF